MRPSAPDGLGVAGVELWSAILGDLDNGWELDARELELLGQAAIVADRLQALDEAVRRDGTAIKGSRGQTVVHPAVAESRQQRLALVRLLGAIEVVDPAEARRSATPAQARARRAADARWGRKAG